LTDNGTGLKHKVNFINPSHQQSGTEEEKKYHYNQQKAKKIFPRKNFSRSIVCAGSNEGIIGDSQIIKQLNDGIQEAKNEQDD
jgi:hypothetical protein